MTPRTKQPKEDYSNWSDPPMTTRIVEDDLSEGAAITGGQTFDQFSSDLPEDASKGFAVVQPSPTNDGGEAGEGSGFMGESEPESQPGRKVLKMSRKMKAAMNKIKAKVGNFPVLWFNAKAQQHPEWALDPEEKEIITDSLEFVFEILNIEFNIETVDITLKSIWWVLTYPVAVIGMIFFIKKAAVSEAHPTEDTNAK